MGLLALRPLWAVEPRVVEASVVKSSAVIPRMAGTKLAWVRSKLPRLAVGIVLRELRITLGVWLIGVWVWLILVRDLWVVLRVLLVSVRRLVLALTLVISTTVWGIVPPIGIGIWRVQGTDPFKSCGVTQYIFAWLREFFRANRINAQQRVDAGRRRLVKQVST